MLRVAALLLTVLAFGQAQAPPVPPQTPAGRDLVLVKPKPAETPRAGVPRGYAVVIGIARYKNLDASRQLQFPESDADAMYRVLINREGGSFPAENVHFLKGEQATLA